MSHSGVTAAAGDADVVTSWRSEVASRIQPLVDSQSSYSLTRILLMRQVLMMMQETMRRQMMIVMRMTLNPDDD